MSLKTVRNYTNGKWVEAETTDYLDVENPTTGQVIARTPLSTAAETNRAIETAADAFTEWGRTPVSRRIQPI